MATLLGITTERALSDTNGGRMLHLSSDPGINRGDLVYLNGEAMAITDTTRTPVFGVMRGAAGTACMTHVAGETGYVGNASLFRNTDPSGLPPAQPVSDPWINLRDRRVWIPQGDEVGPGAAARYWQLQVIGPRTSGALGILQRPPTTP